MFLLNSRRTRFTAAHLRGRSFSRSYGANLPSSLTSLHSSAFGYSPRLPVSVWGTVPFVLLRGFSRQRGIRFVSPYGTELHLTVNDPTDLPIGSSLRAATAIAIVRQPYPSASPHRQTNIGRDGILTVVPSATPFGLTLGTA